MTLLPSSALQFAAAARAPPKKTKTIKSVKRSPGQVPTAVFRSIHFMVNKRRIFSHLPWRKIINCNAQCLTHNIKGLTNPNLPITESIEMILFI